MRVYLDNGDGRGATDYTGAVLAEGRVRIRRVLNGISTCSWTMALAGTGLPMPRRRARVVAGREDGTVLFTGYLAAEPELVLAGAAVDGPAFRVAVQAVSDEWLLDTSAVASPGASSGLTGDAGAVLHTLLSRTGVAAIETAAASPGPAVGIFLPDPAASWSANAGRLASSAYAGYRVLGGSLSLQPAAAAVHRFAAGDGSLAAGTLASSRLKELANDVTVTGEREPTAYVTEVFSGDGSTAVFHLAGTPFHPTGSPSALDDTFAGEAIDDLLWQVNDAGAAMSLTAAGLTLNGGNGQDGSVGLLALAPLELGGNLVIEAGGVVLGSATDAVLCGVYVGTPTRPNCLCGWSVRSRNGATVLLPLVNGAETGTAMTVMNGHRYTLRLRLHCPEPQRVRQRFYANVEGTVQSFGGGLNDAPLALVFEIQDLGVSSNTPATVLFDGMLPTAPAVGSFALVEAAQASGSIGHCRISVNGAVWLRSLPPGAPERPRLTGIAGEGVDCEINSGGMLTFFPGTVPVAGELVTAAYRLSARSVARLVDPVSVAAEAAAGLPGVARWKGRVVRPKARSSADCESAAEALLALATSRDAALSGSCAAVNPGEEMWPGDALSIDQAGGSLTGVLREVTIDDLGAVPEALHYHLRFANDWAENLGITVSDTAASDAVLPRQASTSTGNFAPNLPGLRLLTASGSALQIDAGQAAPPGGGFEVRRRDAGFAPRSDQDLVLRSPVPAFAIPREASLERYYIRAYDGSDPPLYSRVSSAVFVNLPVE